MRTSEVLDKAAGWLDQLGWGRGATGLSHRGPLCASLAISKVAREAENAALYCDGTDTLARALGGRNTDAIWEWNDAPERTKEEVIAMLRAVAATERARESCPVVREAEVAEVCLRG